MAAPLKLAHINIEGSKHLDRVIPFLQEQQADVVCLQELWEHDVPAFEDSLGVRCFFIPPGREGEGVHGMGIFSALPMTRCAAHRYSGFPDATAQFDTTTIDTIHDSQCFMLAVCDVEKDGQPYRIGTTHFPVTRRGEATDFQREDMRALLAVLEQQGELVFTGDFNAPRGGEIFSMLAERYTDNVPPHYATSIDGALHRAGPLQLMIDGIFSTPAFKVSDVVMHDGVSDHCALVASVAKVELQPYF